MRIYRHSIVNFLIFFFAAHEALLADSSVGVYFYIGVTAGIISGT